MSLETNKAIARRYIEMWNTGNVTLADEVISSRYVDHAHPQVPGPASVKQAVLAFRSVFPNFHIAIDTIIGEEDIVALRIIIHKTEDEQRMASRSIWFMRIIDGQMVDLWTGNESVY